MWFWRRFFSFSVLTVSFGLGLGLEPLWTRTWLGLEPLWTWTCLGLDKGGLDYSPNIYIYFPIICFSNHHKLYIIWKLKTSKSILRKTFSKQSLHYHGNGTLKYFNRLLPSVGVSYYKMYKDLLESKLFIILTKYISLVKSESD